MRQSTAGRFRIEILLGKKVQLYNNPKELQLGYGIVDTKLEAVLRDGWLVIPERDNAGLPLEKVLGQRCWHEIWEQGVIEIEVPSAKGWHVIEDWDEIYGMGTVPK